MKILKFVLPIITMVFVLLGCNSNNVADTNEALDQNNWSYAKTAKVTVDITDANQVYHLYFKFRHTADYRYANLYVLAKINGSGFSKNTRYQFKLAEPDGTWLGEGSGDIFNNHLVLYKNYRFAKPGKYVIEVEQNMRENPLIGVSDIGILVEKATTNE